MQLRIEIDEVHIMTTDVTFSADVTFHTDTEQQFRDTLAAALETRPEEEPEFSTVSTTSWVELTFQIPSAYRAFGVTVFAPPSLAPSEARAIFNELWKEQS